MPEIFDASKKRKKPAKPSKSAKKVVVVKKTSPTKNVPKHVVEEVFEPGVIETQVDSSVTVPSQMEQSFQAQQPDDVTVLDVPMTDVASEDSSALPDAPIHSGPSRNVDDYSQIMANESPAHNPFRSFAAKPTSTSFDSQHHEEQILLLLRQHPITQVKWILITIVLLLLPSLFSFVGILNFLPLRIHFFAALGWYLLTFGFALESFLNWFYNVYILTDERVIDVDFQSLLFKNVSTAKIENIEDVSATTKGTLGAVFDYGDVQIQTAGTVVEFEFESVPYPNRVTAFINELIVEEEREKIEGRVN